MEAFLKEIEQICFKYQFTSLFRAISSITNQLHDKNIDIAILGQFKAGKSSFLNHFIGRKILPTGVVPVTSVVTRIKYGTEGKVVLSSLVSPQKTEISVNQIDEFITESKNPKNEKHIAVVDVELPALVQYKKLRFVDTPGTGSVYRHNTDATENWFTEIGIAFVSISAERPLGENEVAMIREISNHTPEVIILLTKVDLFHQAQILEIRDYIETQLQKIFNKKFRIFNYSILDNSEKYKQIIVSEVINPVISDFNTEYEKITKHKVNLLAESCLAYLNIAYQSSLKSEKEKEQLKKIIFDEKLNTNFIQKELNLIAENSKSTIREEIYKILNQYESNLVSELRTSFYSDYASWKGNLFKLSRKYEEWMRNSLSDKLREIAANEQAEFINIIKEINAHFSFFTKSFRVKLSENIYKVLGIKLADEEWEPELKSVKQPNISIYHAFDTPIDLLWFLFPMFIFKKIFGHFFSKQIGKEVSKNIYRLTSGINQIISKKIESGKDQTLEYIINELETLEKVLSGSKKESDEYKFILNKLERELNDGIG